MYFYLLSVSKLTRRNKAHRSVQRNLGGIDRGMSKGRSKDTSRLTIENALVVHWLGLHIFTALANKLNFELKGKQSVTGM